jgi:hypothetical protein
MAPASFVFSVFEKNERLKRTNVQKRNETGFSDNIFPVPWWWHYIEGYLIDMTAQTLAGKVSQNCGNHFKFICQTH